MKHRQQTNRLLALLLACGMTLSPMTPFLHVSAQDAAPTTEMLLSSKKDSETKKDEAQTAYDNAKKEHEAAKANLVKEQEVLTLLTNDKKEQDAKAEAAKQKAIEAQKAELAKAQAKLNETKAALATATADVDNYDKNKQDLLANVETATQTLTEEQTKLDEFNTDNATLDKDIQAKETALEEAKTAQTAAQTAKDEADKALADAKTQKQTEETNLTSLNKELDNLNNAKDLAQQAKDTAITTKAKKQEALDLATKKATDGTDENIAAKQEAQTKVDAARQTQQQAEAALTEKQTAQTALQTDLTNKGKEIDTERTHLTSLEEAAKTAQSAIDAKQKEFEKAQNDLHGLEQQFNDKTTEFNTKNNELTTKQQEKTQKERKKAELEDQKTALESGIQTGPTAEEIADYKAHGAIGFYKYQAKYGENKAAFAEALKLFDSSYDDTNKYINKQGTPNISHSELVALLNFEDPNNTVNLDNFLESLDIIQESNNYRATCLINETDNANLPILKVDPALMVEAILSGNYSATLDITKKLEHSLTYFNGENLSWYGTLHGAFYGESNSWVTFEKGLIDPLIANNTITLSDVYADIVHNKDINLSQYINIGSVGHYLSIVNNKFTVSGAAINKSHPHEYNNNYYTQTFFFGPLDGASYSVEDFKALINAYKEVINPTQTGPTVESITSKIEAIDQEINTLTTTIESLTTEVAQLEQEKNDANQAVTNKSTEIGTLHTNLETLKADYETTHKVPIEQLKTAITNLEQAKANLQTQFDEGQRKVEELQQALTTATTAVTTAETELANIQTRLEQEKAAAQTALTDAEAAVTNKEAALTTATAAVTTKQGEIATKQAEITALATDITTKEADVTAKQTDLENATRTVTDAQAALDAKNVLKQKREELTQKVAEATTAKQTADKALTDFPSKDVLDAKKTDAEQANTDAQTALTNIQAMTEDTIFAPTTDLSAYPAIKQEVDKQKAATTKATALSAKIQTQNTKIQAVNQDIAQKEQAETQQKTKLDQAERNYDNYHKVYTMLDGQNAKVEPTNTAKPTLAFRSEADIKTFVRVLVRHKDGTDSELDGKYYTVKPGSIKVELNNNYLRTLTPGTYTMTIESTDGKAEANFEILKVEKTVVTQVKPTTTTKVVNPTNSQKTHVQPHEAPNGFVWNATSGAFDLKPGYKWNDTTKQAERISNTIVPRTSDDLHVKLYVGILIVALAAIGATAYKLHKK